MSLKEPRSRAFEVSRDRLVLDPAIVRFKAWTE
jgi:hypothetical protein